MAWTNWKWGKPDISMACNGMLAGCVAITAGCAFVAPWAAVVIGLIAGVIVCYGVWFFDHVAKVDDPCGAISVHGLCGVWGVIAVGLFADGTYGAGWNGIDGTVRGLFYGNASQLGAQLIMVAVNLAWAFGVTFALISLVRRFIKLRVSPEVEVEGLDMPEFGALAYPEFVLTTSGAKTAGSAAVPQASDPQPKPLTTAPLVLEEGATPIEIPEAVVIETARRVLEMVRSGEGETSDP
jgi:Amt family ammonium transporter